MYDKRTYGLVAVAFLAACGVKKPADRMFNNAIVDSYYSYDVTHRNGLNLGSSFGSPLWAE